MILKLMFCLILLITTNYVYGERTKDKMYETINSVGCYRRINATHQIGCSSKRGGSVGVIHYCDIQEDLDFILINGTASAYIPVVPTKLFTLDNFNKLKQSSIISGLVLYLDNNTSPFSHENQCPNEQSSLKGTCSKDKNTIWNPHGTGMLFMDIPFPVFYVENEEHVIKMKDCFTKFNNFSYETQGGRSLCALQLNSFMYATTNTPTCRRRSNLLRNINPVKFCDPLGDNNVWGSLHPLIGESKSTKYIVVAARLDTTSMFDKTVGANSPITGIVTLLSVAKILKNMGQKSTYGKNVLFIFFNGETYDYIGSQRMLYDMQEGNFPLKDNEEDSLFPIIKPKDISLFIELGQLSNNKDSKNVFVHYLKENSEIANFYKKLTENSNVLLHNVSETLPPSSLHTFLKNQSDLSGLYLSDHQNAYVNNYYNSIFDNAENIQYQYYNITEPNGVNEIPDDSIQKFIGNVSEMLAKSIYAEIYNVNSTGTNVSADVALIDELIHCYLENPNCRVNKAVSKAKLTNSPSSLYVGVPIISNFATKFTANVLAWMIGESVPPTDPNYCSNKPKNYAFRFYNVSKSIFELNETICIKATLNFSAAVSPAFVIEDYDWSSGKYSSWAESSWEDINMRMFLKPSAAHETLTITIGSMSLILSFIIVWFAKSRSHILFTSPIPCELPADC